jgi:lysophospholipase L1-like esterase
MAGSTSAITDASGNNWTITSGKQVAVNGTADTTTANVIELAYVNGTVWQENISDLWYGKTSPTAAWGPTLGTSTSPVPVTTTPTPTPAPTPTPTPAPTPTPTPAASANDTTVMAGSTSAITDASGNKWTITSAGLVAVNGTPDTTTSGVIELAYVNGTIWQENNNGLWWGETKPNAAWAPEAGTATSPLRATATPTPTPAPTPTTLKLMPLGDSIVEGVVPGGWRAPLYADLTSEGYNVQMVGDQNSNPGGGLPSNEDNDEAIGGVTSEQVQSYIDQNNILATYTPNVIVLSCGGNDMYGVEGDTPQQAYASMVSLCTDIMSKLPNVKLIVGTLPPVQGDPGTNNSTELGQFNLLLPGLTSISPNISVVNVNGAVNLATDIGPDGIHPNVMGNSVIAGVFNTGVEAVVAPTVSAMQSDAVAAPTVTNSTITIAAGTTSATVSQSDVTVAAASGTHMMFIQGSGDTVSLSGGTNTVSDTGSANTYVLPAAGNGSADFTSNILDSGDTLDLKTALAATNWAGTAGTLANYLQVTDSSNGAVLSIAPTSGGAAMAIATISGATSLNLTTLLAHSIT